MKHIYQTPRTICVTLIGHVAIMQASAKGLEGYGGYGGGKSGGSADSRRGSIWDDEED